MRKTFRTLDNKGFHITFENGVTLSTQFGWGNYCENYNGPVHDYTKPKPDAMSDDAEIAIFDENNKWITREYKDDDDDVLGRIKISEWLQILEWCKNWKPKEPK